MAVIKPFRAVRYNPEYITNMQAVVSQPYDRIDDALQREYYASSPYNIVRIVKGRADDGDRPAMQDLPDVYTRAKAYYRRWLDEGALIREGQPALYAYEQRFQVGGERYSRWGVIGAVRLADFQEGVILPHERTYPGPRADRLRLLNALAVHTEPVFLLYPGTEHGINSLLSQTIGSQTPVVDITDNDTAQHRMWVITDQTTIQAIQAEMAPKQNLIIADGHHRYTTGLRYRDARRQAQPDASDGAMFNYVLAVLVSMDDPSLVILPTHREIRASTAASPAAILERARAHFTTTPAASLDACLSAVNADPAGYSFGFYGGDEVGFHVLTLNHKSSPPDLIGGAHSNEWKALPVNVLHEVLLAQIAGMSREDMSNGTAIHYHRDARRPVENVRRGEASFAFFLGSTRMEQIRACVAQGEVMPQKSTDFYPKVITGLVMLPTEASGFGEGRREAVEVDSGTV
jgi:uncharacterized protein (DUF1015 family)